MINYEELDVMFNDWLEFDYEIPAAEPDPCGLVAWYKLDGDADDSSGNDLHGTEMGGPTYVAGQVDQAINLDGVDDYVDCSNNSAFDLTDAVTVAAWIKVTAFDKSWQAIVTKGDNSWRIHRSGGGQVINWATSGLSPLSINGSTNANDGEWHHVAGTYNGAERVLYVDGIPEATVATTGSIDIGTHPVYIGENAQATGRQWSGQIDDVKIFNYGLSGEEIVSVRGLGTVYVPVTSPANISDYEAALEKIVNFKDYDVLLSWWLMEDFLE